MYLLQVGTLREELDKEEMYVEYLERLLSDIELRRQERRASKGEREEGRRQEERGEGEENEGEGIDYTVISGSPDNKQQFLEDQVNRLKQRQEKVKIILVQKSVYSSFLMSGLTAGIEKQPLRFYRPR